MYAQESTTKMTCAWMSRMDKPPVCFQAAVPAPACRGCCPAPGVRFACSAASAARSSATSILSSCPQPSRPGQHLARRKPSRCAKAKPEEKGATTASRPGQHLARRRTFSSFAQRWKRRGRGRAVDLGGAGVGGRSTLALTDLPKLRLCPSPNTLHVSTHVGSSQIKSAQWNLGASCPAHETDSIGSPHQSDFWRTGGTARNVKTDLGAFTTEPTFVIDPGDQLDICGDLELVAQSIC